MRRFVFLSFISLFVFSTSLAPSFAAEGSVLQKNISELFKVGRQIATTLGDEMDTPAAVESFEKLLDRRFKLSNSISSLLAKDIDRVETSGLDYLIDTLEKHDSAGLLAFRQLLSDLEVKLLSKMLYEESSKPVLEPRQARITDIVTRIENTEGIEGCVLAKSEAKFYAAQGESEYKHWNGHLVIVDYVTVTRENNQIVHLALVMEYSDDTRKSLISKTVFEIRKRDGKPTFVFVERKVFAYRPL